MAIIARFVLEQKYQKDCRWAGSSFLIREMAVVKRILAAVRVMACKGEGGEVGDGEKRIMARWRVTSAAK